MLDQKTSPRKAYLCGKKKAQKKEGSHAKSKKGKSLELD